MVCTIFNQHFPFVVISNKKNYLKKKMVYSHVTDCADLTEEKTKRKNTKIHIFSCAFRGLPLNIIYLLKLYDIFQIQISPIALLGLT